jgi:hypothetical protein
MAGCDGGSYIQAAAPLVCGDLVSLTVLASAIGLPPQGARVTAAASMPAAGTGTTAVGAFCRVSAEIAPLDPAAPPIKMELNLPQSWNGKALMYGSGEFNGSILSASGTIRLQPSDLAIPLGRGYATFGSDSGHTGTSSQAHSPSTTKHCATTRMRR